MIDKVAANNAAAAKEFLGRNAREKGVKTTASGLQYKIIDAGNTRAASPRPADQVMVQYRGTLIDGTEFDSLCEAHLGRAYCGQQRHQGVAGSAGPS